MARKTDSNTYRFFVPAAAFVDDHVAVDDPDLARQLGQVLRLTAGDTITLLDGVGGVYTVQITSIARGGITGAVLARSVAGGEPRVQLTLYIALIRGERFEWALQKGTEIGAAAFVPLICTRNVVDGPTDAKKLDRWRRIVREAAEQSQRGIVPTVDAPQPFAPACARAAAAGPALLLYEGQGGASLRQHMRNTTPQHLGLLSGPEGGLTDDEVQLARAAGVQIASLGPRILRAETAPLVAAVAALSELGELG